MESYSLHTCWQYLCGFMEDRFSQIPKFNVSIYALFSVYTYRQEGYRGGQGEGEGGERMPVHVHHQCWSVCVECVCGLGHINCNYYPSLKGATCVLLVTSYQEFNLPQPALPCKCSHVHWPLAPNPHTAFPVLQGVLLS